jgi:hypothetical protein
VGATEQFLLFASTVPERNVLLNDRSPSLWRCRIGMAAAATRYL